MSSPTSRQKELPAQTAPHRLRTYIAKSGIIGVGHRVASPLRALWKNSLRQREKLERWWNLFRDEVAVVRAARNAVAHPPVRMTSDELAAAVDAARYLADLLKEGLGATP